MASVEIEVPFLYEVTYVPPGKRKSVGGLLGGKMAVMIESVTEAEAPLAISWADDDGFGRREGADIHAYGGGFYSRPSDKIVGLQAVRPEHVHQYDSYDLRKFVAGEVPERYEGRLETICGNYDLDRGMHAVEALKDEIRQSASGLLFIDGVLYSRCELPRILASISYRFNGNNIITVGIGETGDSTGAHGMQFALSDFQSAMAWADDRKEMDRQSEIRCSLDVTIHAPAFIHGEQVLRDEAFRICNFLMSHDFDLRKLSDDVIDEWKACRCALKDADADPSDETITHMIDAWERFYTAYEIDEDTSRRGYGSTYRKAGDLYYMALAGLRSQWECRPILEEEFVSGPRP